MPWPKGTVKPNAGLKNSFRLDIPILGPVFFATVGSLEQSITKTTLPDQTAQTTGKKEPIETDVTQMAHHEAEYLGFEDWYAQCQLGVPGHKQECTLYVLNSLNQPVRAFLLSGVWVMGRTIPEFDAGGDGEFVLITWKLSIDDVNPL